MVDKDKSFAVCPVKHCDKQVSTVALTVHLELAHGLKPEQVSTKPVEGRVKQEVLPMGKAQKQAAKDLEIKCFNAMTRVELEEAINLATAIKGGQDVDSLSKRLDEIQAVARERSKARFAKMKEKKNETK